MGISIDKKNRVFTTEIFPGRAQQFQYVSDVEADKEREKRAADRAAKLNAGKSTSDTPAQSAPAKP